MRNLFLLMLISSCTTARVVKTNTPTSISAMAEKYANTITIQDLKEKLTILSADDMEGRETGTAGQRKAAAYIEGEFVKYGLQPVPALNGYQQMYPVKRKAGDTSSNVVGIVEGSDKKDEYVFLTAHYDHLGKRGDVIYNGADDDGSGSVGVMEMAEAFAKAKADGHGPRRTVVFMTVSGEEKGLWGSEYYSNNPFYPVEKTSVDLNTDMVGRVDTERMLDDTLNYVYVVGHDKISSELPLINEAVNDKYTKLTLDYKFDDPNDKNRIYYRSDHYNFARVGIPVLFFYDGMLKSDYHKPTDTVEKINFELYQKRVKLIYYTAWDIANRDEMLKRDKPLPASSR